MYTVLWHSPGSLPRRSPSSDPPVWLIPWHGSGQCRLNCDWVTDNVAYTMAMGLKTWTSRWGLNPRVGMKSVSKSCMACTPISGSGAPSHKQSLRGLLETDSSWGNSPWLMAWAFTTIWLDWACRNTSVSWITGTNLDLIRSSSTLPGPTLGSWSPSPTSNSWANEWYGWGNKH